MIRLHDGLAVYRCSPEFASRSPGPVILVMPYPHASWREPMTEGPLAAALAPLGRTVVSFDPPGRFRSTRPAALTLDEMTGCAAEALSVADVDGPVDLVGHSMGGLCALAFALQHPTRVRRLVLVCAISGYPAIRRWGVPNNWRWYRDLAWWRCMVDGVRLFTGTGSLAVQRRLDDLIGAASTLDPRHHQPEPIAWTDRFRPAPRRARWAAHLRRAGVDLAPLLGEVAAPTLVLIGRHDPQTPPAACEQLARGIPDATVAWFDRSGHAPHVEQREQFVEAVLGFLDRRDRVRPPAAVS